MWFVQQYLLKLPWNLSIISMPLREYNLWRKFLHCFRLTVNVVVTFKCFHCPVSTHYIVYISISAHRKRDPPQCAALYKEPPLTYHLGTRTYKSTRLVPLSRVIMLSNNLAEALLSVFTRIKREILAMPLRRYRSHV